MYDEMYSMIFNTQNVFDSGYNSEMTKMCLNKFDNVVHNIMYYHILCLLLLPTPRTNKGWACDQTITST